MVRLALGLLILVCSFITDNCYSQTVDEQNDNIIVFSDFSGGLNTKSNNFSIPNNQGIIVKNARFDDENGALVKRQETRVYGTADATEPITGMHRLYLDSGSKVLIVTHGDEIEKGADATGAFTNIYNLTTTDRRWQWLTWKNVAIGMDGYNYPVKYDGSSASATNLGAPLAVDAGSGAGPNGTYTYKVACYSTSYTATFNNPSNSVTVSDNDINLTMIPLCPDTILAEDIIGRKVYRIENGGTTYKLLSNGTIADNSTVILTDSDADGALGASYPTGNEIITPPKGKYQIIHNGRLWIGNNPTYPSRIYYSDLDGYEIFYDDAYLDIRPSDGDQITFVKNVLGLLTIGKNNSIQKIYNDEDDTADWSISDPFTQVGCQAPYSVVNTQYGLFYLGSNGIYNFNGQYAELMSDIVTPEIKDISPSNYVNVWSAFYKNTYYMAYTSEKTGGVYNNRVLEYDIINKAFNLDTLNINSFLVLNSGSDVEALYSGGSANGKVYIHTNAVNELVHNTHADFAGTWDDARYIPITAGGDADSPILEIAWTETINEQTATIDAAVGIIDRPDTAGSYFSQYLNLSATVFDKLYWNETIPVTGGDVQFYLRAGATTTDCAAATWQGPYTSPAGTDISAATAGEYAQYKINLTTDNINYTPNVYEEENYVVKLTYARAGASDESTVDFEWQSGWINIKPGYKASLKKIYLYYDWPEATNGTLNVKWENFEGDSDTFSINLYDNPKSYKEYFTNGSLVGETFKFTITESSLNDLKIKAMYLVFELEPLV